MSESSDRLPQFGLFRFAAEAVLLALVAFAPWPFASVEPAWEALLVAGIGVIAILWLADAAVFGKLSVRPDATAAALAGLVALSAAQLLPLPDGLAGTLSPLRTDWQNFFLPAVEEQLPGETLAVTRATWFPLTVDPFLTRGFLGRVAALLLLYTITRSWLANRESFRRLAWIAGINGTALALVGLAQFFSSGRNTVFWTFDTDGDVFGPFVCKNHYPDYILFCLGMGAALLAGKKERTKHIHGISYAPTGIAKIAAAPELVVVACGVVLMVLSIPFTLSRGGILGSAIAAVAVAGIAYRLNGRLSKGLLIAGGVVAFALVIGSWLGWNAVQDRLSTVWSGKALVSREGLWRDTLTLVPRVPLTGTGNGTFVRVEPTVRTALDSNVAYENAHNEYLEALVEGGTLRLGLTLLLAGVALTAGVRAYRRWKDRSVGRLVLGGLFGLIGLVVHSVMDFGIHIPAVALLATVVLAHLVAAADDPNYAPARKPRSNEIPSADPRRLELTGFAVTGAMLLVGFALTVLVYEAWLRGRADNRKMEAAAAAKRNTPERHRLRLEALTEAVRLTPADGDAWFRLSQARFDAALDEAKFDTMALAGGWAALLPNDAFTAVQNDQIRVGLYAARAARGASLLMPQPHERMGVFHAGFAQSEPAQIHYERARRVIPVDADIWLLCGTDAAARGDLIAAKADWRKAMELSPLRVPQVLRDAGRILPPERMLDELIPADPLLIIAAADSLYPDQTTVVLRQPYIARAVAIGAKRDDWPARSWAALARAYDETNDSERSAAAWKAAVGKSPDDQVVREAYARWLEADERYAEAEAELAYLRARSDTRALRERLAAVRHALELKAAIEAK